MKGKGINMKKKKRASILIVDSDGYSCLLLEEMLQTVMADPKQYDIICVSKGKEALKLVKRNKIDLIFMEIKLKDMDGLKVTKRIKELNPSLPVIIETATVLENTKQMVLEAGAESYIFKPIDAKQLKNALDAFMKVPSDR